MIPYPPKQRDGKRWTVCAAIEIAPGSRRIVEQGAVSIGVFNIEGRFYALANDCPHQGAPLCCGPIAIHESDENRDARYLVRCPLHGWEYDITTGIGTHPYYGSTTAYEVTVDDNGDIVVTLS